MTEQRESRDVVKREDRKKARPNFVLFLWIVVMWQLLWGEVTWANVAGGVAVALLISIFVPMPRVPVGDIDVNWGAMIKLFATFAVDFLVASFTVAWLAVRRADPPPSAVVEIPMRTREDLTLASAIALINLQPGGLVIDIDNRRQTVTMHLLDGSSTGRIDRTIEQLGKMERQVIKAFENRDIDADPADTLGHDHADVHPAGAEEPVEAVEATPKPATEHAPKPATTKED